MTNTLRDRLKGYAAETFEAVFHTANAVSRECGSPTLAQIGAKLEFAAKVTGQAKAISTFGAAIVGEAGDNLNKGIEKIDQWVSNGKSAISDVEAGCEILQAVGVIEDWSARPGSVTNRDAAMAFDHLFEGIATFFAKLPFVGAAEYASFIGDWGKKHMFAKVVKELEWHGGNDNPAWDKVREQTGP